MTEELGEVPTGEPVSLIGQRFHGWDSPVFVEWAKGTPMIEAVLEDCLVCGHRVFVRQEPGVTEMIVTCAHCAVAERGADPSTFLNLEACPEPCMWA